MTFDDKKLGSQVDLGDLGFKAEDFEEKVEVAYRTRAAQQLAQVITNEANRILEEKLKRAPEVFHHCRTNYTCPHGRSGLWSGNTTGSQKTYKARLVCVEEIGR